MTTPEDRSTKILRFSLGAAAGFFFGVIAASGAEEFRSALLFGAVAGLIFGLLAMRFGNDFWEALDTWPWFRG